jgi:hypothetical protein
LQRKNGNYIYYRGDGEAIARQKAGAELGASGNMNINPAPTATADDRTWHDNGALVIVSPQPVRERG